MAPTSIARSSNAGSVSGASTVSRQSQITDHFKPISSPLTNRPTGLSKSTPEQTAASKVGAFAMNEKELSGNKKFSIQGLSSEDRNAQRRADDLKSESGKSQSSIHSWLSNTKESKKTADAAKQQKLEHPIGTGGKTENGGESAPSVPEKKLKDDDQSSVTSHDPHGPEAPSHTPTAPSSVTSNNSHEKEDTKSSDKPERTGADKLLHSKAAWGAGIGLAGLAGGAFVLSEAMPLAQEKMQQDHQSDMQASSQQFRESQLQQQGQNSINYKEAQGGGTANSTTVG